VRERLGARPPWIAGLRALRPCLKQEARKTAERPEVPISTKEDRPTPGGADRSE
jgi:hypothetical protein